MLRVKIERPSGHGDRIRGIEGGLIRPGGGEVGVVGRVKILGQTGVRRAVARVARGWRLERLA